MNRISAARRAFAGFSLVETMVALAIGMLATVIVMQVFAISESQKRTITSGADAQSDGAVVLYLIERDLRQAGFGLSTNPEDFIPKYTTRIAGGVLTNGILAQCTTVNAYNTTRGVFAYADSTFAPMVINPAGYAPGDAGTDVVLVNYGTSNGMIGKGVVLKDGTATTQAGGNVMDFVVKADKGTSAGFMNGDLILAVPPTGGIVCAIAEITGLPNGGDPGCTDFTPPSTIIRHNAVAYPSFYTGCTPVNATWNQAGVDLPYNLGSQLYNLGPVGSFVSRVYAVRNSNLTMCDVTVNDCMAAVAVPPDPAVWAPIANGVVGLRAEYGHDIDFNGTVDAWDAITPLGADRANVAAVRLAVVVRSSQFEREDVTTAAPVWNTDAAATLNAPIDVSGSGSDWQRFRYKKAQSIVPLRNMIWGQQN